MSIHKRDTGSLELSTRFFQHHTQNPVTIYFSYKQLTCKRSELSICVIHERLRRRICHNPLWEQYRCPGSHFVQFSYWSVEWVPVLPFLFPYKAGRMPIEIIFTDMI